MEESTVKDILMGRITQANGHSTRTQQVMKLEDSIHFQRCKQDLNIQNLFLKI